MNLHRITLGTLLAAAFACGAAHAQCRQGDCQDGRGTYDFGWCVYSGTFQGGKPHGYGVMDYGDYRYEGPFEAGREHGTGTLFYPDGRTKPVAYAAGREVRRAFSVAFSEAEGIGCVSGDCENGRGRKVSPGGAVYEGDFLDGRRSGEGRLVTPTGDVYEGAFDDGRPHGQGTFAWASGYQFTGTFVDGEEHTGTYTDPDGRTASLEAGQLVAPPPSAERVRTITYEIRGDRVIVDQINGVDADGRKRLVLYAVGHVTRELYWSDVPVAVTLRIFEVDAPYDMDVETIRQKIYEQTRFWSRTAYGGMRQSYPALHVAPGTSTYDAKSYLAGQYGPDAWTKAESTQLRLDW